MKLKEVIRIILEVTDESMTRMEAWEATVAAGADVPWETFKRLQTLAEAKKK